MRFASPLAALAALTFAVPLGVAFVSGRRLQVVRTALGLQSRPALERSRVAIHLTLALLVGLACAQPQLTRTRARLVRADAEVFYVLDSSRSMLAATSPAAPSRFARAQRTVLRVASLLPELPAGLASLTDRPLPYLFPTSDQALFRATIEREAGILRPPAANTGPLASSLVSLGELGEQRYFDSSARRRVVVVLTDGETRPAAPATFAYFVEKLHVHFIFVRLWAANERVYTNGRPEIYRPDPTSVARLDAIARADGEPGSYREGQTRAIAAAVRRAAGSGPRRSTGTSAAAVPLGPYLVAAAGVLIALLLRRRIRTVAPALS